MYQRRKDPIPTLPAERLKELLKDNGMKQSDLYKDYRSSTFRLHCSEVSELCNARRPLTETKAQDIIDHFFPEINLNLLMGRSDDKTKKDAIRATLLRLAEINFVDNQRLTAMNTLIERYGFKIEMYSHISGDTTDDELRALIESLGRKRLVKYLVMKNGVVIKELDSTQLKNLEKKIEQTISTLFSLFEF